MFYIFVLMERLFEWLSIGYNECLIYFDLLMVVVICFVKNSFLSIKIPRYLIVGDHSSIFPLISILLVWWLENKITVDLDGFMVIFQTWNHD